MKRRLIKYTLLLTVVGTMLCGCAKVWEEECTECIPLPETEVPVTPDPWEPGETDEKPIGE
jgi:hypothetical protein